MSFDDFSAKLDRVSFHPDSSEQIQEVLNVPHEAGKGYIQLQVRRITLVSDVMQSRGQQSRLNNSYAARRLVETALEGYLSASKVK